MLVLASASPRRRELLSVMGIKDFKVMPSEAEERLGKGLTPEETVAALSRDKAEDVAGKAPDDTVVAADTMVFLNGTLLGKPGSREEAVKMLKKLSGRSHSVYTGVTVIGNGKTVTRVCETQVFFRELEDREIDEYVNTGEPMDKAGAYGIQGRAAVFVEKIEGDFYNVVGLPLCMLYTMLEETGYRVLPAVWGNL